MRPNSVPIKGSLKRDRVFQRVNVNRALAASCRTVETDTEADRLWAAALRAPLPETGEWEQLLQTFCVYLHALRNASAGVDLATFNQVYRLSLNALQRAKVNPMTSKVATLHGHLRSARARFFERRNQPVAARWNLVLAALNDGVVVLPEAPPHLKFELGDQNPVDQQRLRGRLVEALAEREAGATCSPWTTLAMQAQLTGDLRELLGLVIRTPRGKESDNLPKAILWSGATSSREPSTRWRRAHLQNASAHRFVTGHRLEPVLLCGFSKRPLYDRLLLLSDLLEAMETQSAGELEMLVLGFLGRKMHQARCPVARDFFWGLYRANCLQISEGEQNDIWSIFGADDNDAPPLTAVPMGLVRSLRTISLTFGLVSILGIGRFRELFSRGFSRELREHERERIFALLTSHLEKMKGPLMKLGQLASILGMESGQGGDQLASLYNQSPAMDAATVRASIEAALEAPVEQKFKEFDYTPIGVGSVGQVHRATLLDGRVVAVKVRFSGIESAIRFDVRLLRTLSVVLGLVARRMPMNTLIKELGKGLLNECDYQLEARNQEAFRTKYAHDPRIVIPAVVSKYSTNSLLVTEYVKAASLQQFLESASPAEKIEIAGIILEFVVSSCRDGFFQTDNHLGNFLVLRAPLRVVFLDFGNVKVWDRETAAPWSDLIRAAHERNYSRFRRGTVGMGIADGAAGSLDFRAFYKTLTDRSMALIGPSDRASFDFQTLHTELRELFWVDNPNLSVMRLHPDYVYALRVYFSLIGTLATIGAPLDWHTLIRKIMYTDVGLVPSDD